LGSLPVKQNILICSLLLGNNIQCRHTQCVWF